MNVLHLDNIELEGVSMQDYPKFCDAYISYAEYKDGTPLTDAELDLLMETDSIDQYINETAHESIF